MNSARVSSVALVGILLVAGCTAGTRPDSKAAAPTDPGDPKVLAAAAAKFAPGTDYRLAPQDQLTIAVYQEPDLNRDTRVSETGRISLPLVGEVEVAGLSSLEAEAKLRELLKAYLVEPSVAVTIKEYHSRTIVILGEVEKPGSYVIPTDHPLTCVEAIAQAGGFTKFASPNKTRIVRKVGTDFQSLTVPVADVTSGDKSKDVALRPDDVVFIPQTLF